MKPKILLRIASLAMIFHLIGHTFGHLGWKKATDPVKLEVINQMTGHKFPFMGTIRSMGDYFDGFSYATSIGIILMAVILWVVAGSLKETTVLSFKIMITVTICLFVWSIDEFIFFFPFAACTTLFAAILALIAFVQMKSQKSICISAIY